MPALIRKAAALIAGPLLLLSLTPFCLGQSQPSPPQGESVQERLGALGRLSRNDRTPRSVAEQAGLEFCVAMAEADGKRIAPLLEVVGYQPLPLAGDLPDPPHRPIFPLDLAKRISARQKVNLRSAEAASFSLKNKREIQELFPAISQWMLDADWALICQPVSDADWPQGVRCLVIRVRALKPTIVGGNLVE